MFDNGCSFVVVTLSQCFGYALWHTNTYAPEIAHTREIRKWSGGNRMETGIIMRRINKGEIKGIVMRESLFSAIQQINNK